MYRSTFYQRGPTPLLCLLLCIWMALTLNTQKSYAQTYANSQDNGVTGICILCGVLNPDNAVNANLDDYSTFDITVGLLGVTVYQDLIFPAVTTSNGCDSLVIGIGSSNAIIDLNLFGGVTAETYNGATPNGDATVLSSTILRLLDGNTRAEALLKPSANFDRVRLTLSSQLVGLLNGFRIYYAYHKSASPEAPTVASSNVTACSGQTALLSATGPAGATFNWFTTASGGASIFTGANYVTPALFSNTTYYVESSAGGCPSTTRTPVNITVNPIPAAPIVASTNVTICSGQTATLEATAPIGATFNWYTTSAGGTPEHTGATFVTPTLLSSTVYYVESEEGTCVSSTRTAVNVTVNTAPLAPTVASTEVSVCSGQSATLEATAPIGASFNWYTTASGGTPEYTGAVFTTLPLLSNTTYYVESEAGSCTSTSRTSVNVTVNSIPLAPSVASTSVSICAGETATLEATAPIGATFTWFTTASGGTPVYTGALFTTPTLISSTVYYVESTVGTCTSPTRTAVNVTVNSAPNAPTVASNSVSICSGQTASLEATAPLGATFYWYTTASGGTPIFTGANFTTPILLSNTLYYVEAVIGTCSSDTRTAVSVNVTSTPNAPTVASSNITICSGQSATLQATEPLGATFNWFTTASGGTSVFTGPIYITPALVANTTYYVEASVGSCASTIRTAVNVTVNSNPVAPTVASSNVSICSGESATLEATAPVGATFSWYTTSSGGLPVFIGANFTTPILLVNTVYYVEASIGTCASTSRTAVNVTVNPIPSTPTVVSSNVSICSGQTATLQASGPGGATFKWYTTASGGTSLFTGATYITPSLVASTTYYVEASFGTCASTARTAVNVTVTSAPAAPSVASSNVTICSGQTATLQATAPVGATFNWYTSASGGTSIFTGATFITPNLVASTTYYVEASAGTCASATRTAVTITVTSIPLAPTVASSNITICSLQTATLQATAPVGATFNWYTTASGGTPVYTGATYTTPSLATNTVYYVESVVGTCTSTSRTAVNVFVTPIPAAPSVTPTSATVCSGQSAQFTATAPLGSTFSWYTASSGGAPVFTGTIFNTPALFANTTYYVESTNGSCASSTRTAVTATVQSCQNAVTSLTLVNALTNTDIGPLNNGDILDLATLPAGINVRANIASSIYTKSVVFTFSATPGGRIENEAPFALFGDNSGSYNSWCCLNTGTYSLSATPYSGNNGGGTAGSGLSISFQIIDSRIPLVLSYTLVNADTDGDIGPLVNGQVLNLSTLPPRINIRANANDITKSVYFDFSINSYDRIENEVPFALFTDIDGDYAAWCCPAAGNYTIVATPYSQIGATGTVGPVNTISFSIISGLRIANIETYPNPIENNITISIEGQSSEESQVVITDLNGKEFYSGTMPIDSSTEVDLSQLNMPAGIYILKATSGDEIKVKKIIKR